MGTIGWVAINIVLISVLAALIWGPTALFVIALVMTPLMLLILIGLASDFRFGGKQ